MRLALAYPGTTPSYWLEATDELLVTALDVLEQRAENNTKPAPRRRPSRKGRRGRAHR